uniref:ATP synthase F0 subunit 8 n=1 Tax=Eysarcoris aeneus TaxID=1331316 RepID=A0A650FB38_9HEMI|nr:ATP synthase F0 subunit 8 [Eysarcoris aeneus]
MPQMSPLWWEILFMMFILSYILMNIMIYFTPQMKQDNKNNKMYFINQSNWKW